MTEGECRHGMVPAYCADCRGLLSAEEQDRKVDNEMLNNLREWNA